MVAIANPARFETEIPYARKSDPPVSSSINVADWERIASGVGGAFLVFKGLERGGLLGLGMAGTGAALVYRGLTGHCHLYEALGINTAMPALAGVKFEATVVIDEPREEAYRMFREFSEHPRFSDILQVTQIRPGTALWSLKDPMGAVHQWEAEVIADHPGEYMAWRSTSSADVRSYGAVRFEMAPGGLGTQLHMTLIVHPPRGSRAFADALSALPADWGDKHLQRFQEWVQSREPASIPGLAQRF
jgi:uncharacterized membrane protein